MAIKDRLKSLEAQSAPLAAAQWYQECADDETLGPLLIGCLLYLIGADVLSKPPPLLLARFKAQEAQGEPLADLDGDEGAAWDAGLVLLAWNVFVQVPACCLAPNARQTVLELLRSHLATVREDAGAWPLKRVAVLLEELDAETEESRDFLDLEVLARVRNFKP
jgi:hypothetical protein